MKNIYKIFALLLGLLVIFYACEEEDLGPVLNTDNITAPQFISPENNTSYILLKENTDSILTTLQWTATDFGIDNLPDANYILKMGAADSNFTNATTLTTTTELSYNLKVGTINSKIIGMGFVADIPVNMEFQITSNLNNNMDPVISNVLTLTFTAYSDVIEVKPIYLLGDATEVDWDNMAALEMTARDIGVYAIVATLDPAGDWYKFLSARGQWAPQWGTDAAGTFESGNLVYRATEADPDPPAIPMGDILDDYLIIADTINMTYVTEETVQTLHLIGDATTAGWNNTIAVPMTKDAPGKFSLVTTLSADASEGFKFLEFQGAWEPMIGQDGEGTFETGFLKYRRVGDPDVPSIPPPAVTGSYLIEVDIAAGTYKVTQQ